MKLVPYTNIVESVQKEVKQAKLDYKAGLIDIKTLQYVARKLDNVRDTAAFNAVPSEPVSALESEVPPECRQRLCEEGKPYPRSSCAVCGQFSPKWRECDARLAAEQALSGKNPDSDCHGR